MGSRKMLTAVIAISLIAGSAESILAKNGAPAKDEAADEAGDAHAQQSISRGFSFEGHEELGAYGENHGETYSGGYDHFGGNFEAEKYYGYEGHYHEHKHDPSYHKASAIKALLIPLAGVALLGAAAAFVSNPILLQLGVISGTYGRRKRSADETAGRDRLGGIQLLERFVAQVPADEMRSHEERLFADYLTCSGAAAKDSCLERLACELHSSEGAETDVMAVIADVILGNRYVPDVVKSRVAKAIRRGRSGRDCGSYECTKLSAAAAGSLDGSIRR